MDVPSEFDRFFSSSEGAKNHLNLLYSGPDTNDEQMKVPAAVLQHAVDQSEVGTGEDEYSGR